MESKAENIKGRIFELIKEYYGTELSPEFLEGIRQKLLLVSH